MNSLRKAVVVIACALFCMSAQSASAASYTFTDLGLGTPYDINNAGQVVGDSGGHAVIWNNGGMTDLGTLGSGSSCAMGINNQGQVVGYTSVPIPSPDVAAFVWQNGSMSLLMSYGNGGMAYAINDHSQAVGYSIAMDSAALWDTTGNVLKMPFDHTGARDINNLGQILVGTVLWDLNTRTTTTFDAFTATAAINDRNQVVGVTNDGHAKLWSNGSYIDIGLMGASAADINNVGQVVGSNVTTHSPYLWFDGNLLDLNGLIADTGWVLNSATGINDLGQIVGTASFNGQNHAYLLTPDSAAPAPVPEPASMLLVGSALAGLGCLRRLKKRTC